MTRVDEQTLVCDAYWREINGAYGTRHDHDEAVRRAAVRVGVDEAKVRAVVGNSYRPAPAATIAEYAKRNAEIEGR